MRFAIIGALLLLPVFLTAQTPRPPIKRTNPPTLSKPTGYTHVVETVGAVKTVYISGQIAFDGNGNVVGAGDMKAQAERCSESRDGAPRGRCDFCGRRENEQLHHRHVEGRRRSRSAGSILWRERTGQHFCGSERAGATRTDVGNRSDCRRSRRRWCEACFAVDDDARRARALASHRGDHR